LHYGEPWFHGDIRPGSTDPAEAREYAASLVLANKYGTFVYRDLCSTCFIQKKN
jgi:hypothetical protein